MPLIAGNLCFWTIPSPKLCPINLKPIGHTSVYYIFRNNVIKNMFQNQKNGIETNKQILQSIGGTRVLRNAGTSHNSRLTLRRRQAPPTGFRSARSWLAPFPRLPKPTFLLPCEPKSRVRMDLWLLGSLIRAAKTSLTFYVMCHLV